MSTRSCWCARPSCAAAATAASTCGSSLGDRTGTRRRPSCGTRAARTRELCRAGAPSACAAATACTRATARSSLVAAAARRPRPGEYDAGRPARRPAARRPSAMEADLRELVATVQRPAPARAARPRARAESSERGRRYRDAPAAKHYHQAYRARAARALLDASPRASARSSATFPGIDRDVAVTGALLHDIGKLEAYTAERPAIDLTDAGRLQGEIPLGYYRVRRAIEDLPGFPPRARRRRCCTSSSPTTARSSTAARSSRARARRRSCT